MEEDWDNFYKTVRQNTSIEYKVIEKKEISHAIEKWVGGIYYNDNIYGIPTSFRRMVRFGIDQYENELYEKIKTGTYKWTGGCAYQGKIYGFPRKENSLLMFDLKEKTSKVLPLPVRYRGEHHYGGILTDGGIVYQPPRNTDHILVIDLNHFITKELPLPEWGKRYRFCGMIQCPDGVIYLTPEKGERVLRYELVGGEMEYIGSPMECSVFGPVMGYDGNIYGFGIDGNGILKIDTRKKRVSVICEEIGDTGCYGSIVGINGRIYGIPAQRKEMYELDIMKQKVRKIFTLQESGEAKCAGAGIFSDGTICFVPAFGAYVYYIKPSMPIKIEQNRIANRFFNTSY